MKLKKTELENEDSLKGQVSYSQDGGVKSQASLGFTGGEEGGIKLAIFLGIAKMILPAYLSL
jgi:hypothetical protein